MRKLTHKHSHRQDEVLEKLFRQLAEAGIKPIEQGKLLSDNPYYSSVSSRDKRVLVIQ